MVIIMIRHIVTFKFKDFAEGRSKEENVAITKSMLDALPAEIDLIKSSFTAIGAAGANGDNADLLLISDFESFEALNAYIVHPKHKAVGEFMRPVRISRACIDIEI